MENSNLIQFFIMYYNGLRDQTLYVGTEAQAEQYAASESGAYGATVRAEPYGRTECLAPEMFNRVLILRG